MPLGDPYRTMALPAPVRKKPSRPCVSCLLQEKPVRIRRGYMKFRESGEYFYECEDCGDTWR